MAKTCPACGNEILYGGRGRPRRYCEECTPPGSSTSAWFEAWLAEHREEIEAERKERHAAWMTEWRAQLKQNKATMAANRRALEAKRKAAS